MIAAKHMDPLVGIDTHIIMIPSPAGPIPTPLPNPYIGMVFDPMDYVPVLGATVYINGMPRGVAGSSGQALPPHLPLGGPFMKPPSNESEIFMGSATVVVDGDPQSFLALPVLSCQDIGMPAPPRPKKKSVAKSLMLPTTVVLSVPMGPIVLIGGPPTISMMAMAMKGAMAGLKKLKGLMKASKKVKKLSDKIHKAANKLCDKLGIGDRARAAVHKAICTVTGHPVDVATGKVFTDHVDFEIPGPLSLAWERTWYSTSTYRGPLGHGWHHALDSALHVGDEALVLRTSDGRHVGLPAVGDGQAHFDRKAKLTLRRQGNEYRVRGSDGRTQVFVGAGAVLPLVRVEDDRGNRLSLAYDGHGRLTAIVDSGGRELLLHYSRDGLLTHVEGPHPEHAGARLLLARYEYDDRDNLLHAYDALEQRMRYEYRGHLLARETNRNGLSFYFEYDGPDEKARCIHTWGDGGIYDHKLSYGPRITTVENSLAAKTTYHHRDGLVWKTVDALGHVTLCERNEWSEIIGETDALGQVTGFVRDERGNLIEEKTPDGAITRIEYDADDHPITVHGPVGGTWTWRYDDRGRLVERTDALGQRTRFEWNGPRLVGVTDPSGHGTLLAYDAAGNLSRLRTPDGAERRWEHDRLGRCVRVVDPAGNVEARVVDALGRITRVLDPDGSERELAYDGEGNVVRAKDRHYDVEFAYAGMNRLVSRKQSHTVVRFAYDSEEILTAIHNELGAVYRFVLDATGEIVEEHGFDGLVRKYERDPAGRVRKVLRPAGLVTEYAYDAAGRMTAVKHLDAQGAPLSQERYQYRADGQMTLADNGTIVVRLEWDVLGRLVKEAQGSDTVESEFGLLGLRSRMRTSRGHVVELERNVVGDVVTMRAGGGPLVAPGSDATHDAPAPTWQVTFSRSPIGLELERHLPGGVRGRWERDKLGRPLKHEIWSGSRLVGARSYTWEPNDRLKMVVDALRGPVQFSHDGLGNLVSAAYADGKVDLRMPDAVGNLFRSPERKDCKYGPAGQLLESYGRAGVTRYAYDPEGNLTLKVLPDGQRWKYEWDGAGMLAKVVRPDGQEVAFGYDALGRRVWKRYRGKTTRWVWDGNVPVHEWVEVDPEGVAAAAPPVAAADGTSAHQRAVDLSERMAQGPPAAITWVFEPDSFAPIAKLGGGEQHSIITDHLGTPTAMLDSAGREVWSADIDVYGGLRDVVGDRNACPFRWPGQYEDHETGLYYNRFRYYDPEVGEYVSQDPSGIDGGRALYAYPLDPLAWIDLFGLNVSTGAGRDHVTYRGVKNGKPYTGYASAPSSLGLTPDEIVARRYGDDFSKFGGSPPSVVYSGSGVEGKQTARGLEQHYYEQDVKTHGKAGVANAQNPVGPNNPRRAKYKKAANKHLGCK